ncbi:hypothetical protein AB1Y20_002471 [Prymnesium parvum]|uniref:Uncharacterized protein n=1 Tax=Prymnesium parvum TaxID=97485 RepID=A0AB34JAZ5_PRYPA
MEALVWMPSVASRRLCASPASLAECLDEGPTHCGCPRPFRARRPASEQGNKQAERQAVEEWRRRRPADALRAGLPLCLLPDAPAGAHLRDRGGRGRPRLVPSAAV